jgi:hypothetical protein
MADIGAAARTKLVGTVAVAAIVGTRIYPDHLPQKATLPAAVYHVVSGSDEVDLAGMSGVAHSRIQIDSYAATRTAANALSTTIRDAMAATHSRGLWGTVATLGTTPQGGERHDTQSVGDGSDERQFITMRDYLISYTG